MLLQGREQKSPSQGTGLSNHLLVLGDTRKFQFRKNWHFELKKFGVSFVMTGAVLVFEIVYIERHLFCFTDHEMILVKKTLQASDVLLGDEEIVDE